jgi:SAM-dependent methyltransferase
MNVWSTIYERNVWRGTESLSGPGSGSAATRHVGPAIVELVERHGVTSVLDLGCGDSFWMPDLPGYFGVDVAPEAIARAKANHPERARRYHRIDLRSAGAFDLVILRDVVQHLTLEEGVALVGLARAAGRWLLASSYRGGDNVGCDEPQLLRGWAYDADLEVAPFGLGEPLEVIPDGYAYDGDAVRDPRKVLGLWAS